MPTHPRKTAGTIVHAKVHFVAHESEARRRHGSLWSQALVPGTAIRVDQGTAERASMSACTCAKWELNGGFKKQQAVNIRSVKRGPPPDPSPTGTPPNQGIGQPQQQQNAAVGHRNAHTDQEVARAAAAALEQLGHGHGNRNDDSETSEIEGAPRAAGNQIDPNAPVQSPHGAPWLRDRRTIQGPVKGPISVRDWCLGAPVGDEIRAGSDRGL